MQTFCAFLPLYSFIVINTDSKKRKRSSGKSGVDWITVNGAHIPLTESGDVASGGQSALKGKNFSTAKSKSSGGESGSDTGKSKKDKTKGTKKAEDHVKSKGKSKRYKVLAKKQEEIEKRFIGQKTHDGIEIKSFSIHALDRIGGRTISPGRIDKMITQGKVSDGDPETHPHTKNYDILGSRMVIDTQTGNVVTLMWRKGKKK